MRVSLGWKRGSKNKDAKLALLRRADTERDTAYGIGGRTKLAQKKPISLAPIKFPDDDPSSRADGSKT